MPTKPPATIETIVDAAARSIAKLAPRLQCDLCRTAQQPTQPALRRYLERGWPRCCDLQMTLTTSPSIKKPKPTPDKKES